MIGWNPASGVRNFGYAFGVHWLYQYSGSSPCSLVFRVVRPEEALTIRSSRENG